MAAARFTTVRAKHTSLWWDGRGEHAPLAAIEEGMAAVMRRHPDEPSGLALALDSVTVTRADGGGPPLTVLDAVSFHVWPGEIVAIRGGRRAGKTTLLRVAAGCELPQSGTVWVGGKPITGVSGGRRARRARAVGYVPKRPRFADRRSVADHVALPLLAARVPLASATVRAYAALDRVDALELADTAACELTPVERCRVALAQALVARPAVLLVDEPGMTANAEERSRLHRLLWELARERPELAIVMTTRDDRGLAGARVLTLADGRLTEPVRDADVIPLPVRERGD